MLFDQNNKGRAAKDFFRFLGHVAQPLIQSLGRIEYPRRFQQELGSTDPFFQFGHIRSGAPGVHRIRKCQTAVT